MSACLPSPLVIATRESRLALWQAEHVQARLRAAGHEVTLLGMTTRGDQILDRSLSKVGGKGLFVKELEAALEDGRAHLAVHSLKDVPMALPEGFALAAILEREDPRDALVCPRHTRLEDLPQGARVGTSSLRRMVQLLALRPDLQLQPVRGNLDTRLRKLDEGHFDALVLAAAGLKRLGLGARIASVFEPDVLTPAAGQGALGIEVRSEAKALHGVLAALNHRPTWLGALAERAVSRALGGSCSMPLAAFATWQADGSLRLDAALGDVEQPLRPLLRTRVQAVVGHEHEHEHEHEAEAEAEAEAQAEAEAEALGLQAANALRAAGAAGYLAASPS